MKADILASPNTLGHSPRARLTVTMIEVPPSSHAYESASKVDPVNWRQDNSLTCRLVLKLRAKQRWTFSSAKSAQTGAAIWQGMAEMAGVTCSPP